LCVVVCFAPLFFVTRWLEVFILLGLMKLYRGAWIGVANISCGLIMKNNYIYRARKVFYALYGRVANAAIGEKDKWSLVRHVYARRWLHNIVLQRWHAILIRRAWCITDKCAYDFCKGAGGYSMHVKSYMRLKHQIALSV